MEPGSLQDDVNLGRSSIHNYGRLTTVGPAVDSGTTRKDVCASLSTTHRPCDDLPDLPISVGVPTALTLIGRDELAVLRQGACGDLHDEHGRV